jgi:hypothetical protein
MNNKLDLMQIIKAKEGVRGTDDAKLRYYRAILNYNILPGYRMGEGIYMGMKAIAIQKSK